MIGVYFKMEEVMDCKVLNKSFSTTFKYNTMSRICAESTGCEECTKNVKYLDGRILGKKRWETTLHNLEGSVLTKELIEKISADIKKGI